MIVGYSVKAGPSCPHAKYLEGLLILIEDAYDTPDILPPFDECRHDSCECEHNLMMANEVPRGTRVAEWADKGQQAKQTTRRTSPVSSQKKSGCASVLLFVLLLMLSIAIA
jgi:hypothetical protein